MKCRASLLPRLVANTMRAFDYKLQDALNLDLRSLIRFAEGSDKV